MSTSYMPALVVIARISDRRSFTEPIDQLMMAKGYSNAPALSDSALSKTITVSLAEISHSMNAIFVFKGPLGIFWSYHNCMLTQILSQRFEYKS